VIDASPVNGKYEAVFDRHSAHEMLLARAEAAAKEAEEAEALEAADDAREAQAAEKEREFKAARRYSGGASETRSSRSRKSTSSGGFGKALTDVVLKELKGTTGRRLVRGILGSLFKGR
jgi:hypothetical protein